MEQENILGRLLVIIPCYNEELNIERVVEELTSKYSQYDYVVVNDGSSDGSSALCRKKGYDLLDLPVNLGLAGAFQTGMRYAYEHDYDYALQLDGDGQHDPRYIGDMLEKMESGSYDIVIGSRFVTEKKKFSARMAGNSLISGCIRLTTGQKITDPTSGLRVYNRRMIRRIAETVNCSPEPDTVCYFMRCGAHVSEVQVSMRDRIAGKSYLNVSSSIKYMFTICSSILVIQWFRKKEI